MRAEVTFPTILALLFWLLGLNLTGVPAVHGEEKKFDLTLYLTKEEALELAFPGADEVVKERKWLDEAQKEAISEVALQPIDDARFTFYVGMKNGKPMGYMVIEHQIGKSFPITFMVVLNVDGSVRDVEVMVYREPRGDEVKQESFMSQFFGMDAGSDFRDVTSITGATLSVRAITRGVQRVVAAYRVLYLQNGS